MDLQSCKYGALLGLAWQLTCDMLLMADKVFSACTVKSRAQLVTSKFHHGHPVPLYVQCMAPDATSHIDRLHLTICTCISAYSRW